jgi:hypothetical protein
MIHYHAGTWGLGTAGSCRGCKTSCLVAGAPVGARNDVLALRLHDLLLSGRSFDGGLRMAGLRRGYMTSCAAGGGLHQCDVQQVFSKVADGGLL